MNEGVQILIERMKTNPEEFVPEVQYGTTKWAGIINTYNEYLTTEESETINKAYKDTVHQVMRERFTEAVMKELLDPKEETNPYLYSNVASGTVLGGTTLARSSVTLNNTNTITNVGAGLTTNSLTLGKTTVTDTQLHELLHLKSQMELERQKLKQKQSKTLFGRLFNYS